MPELEKLQKFGKRLQTIVNRCKRGKGLDIYRDGYQRNALTSPPERNSPVARVPPVPKLLAPTRAFYAVNVSAAQLICLVLLVDEFHFNDTQLKHHSESYIGQLGVPMSQDILLALL